LLRSAVPIVSYADGADVLSLGKVQWRSSGQRTLTGSELRRTILLVRAGRQRRCGLTPSDLEANPARAFSCPSNSEMLGHSSVSLTLDTYSHVLLSMQSDAAAKMEALFAAEQAAI